MTQVSAPALRCETCHADATPNAYGPGHRTLPTTAQVPHFPDPSHAAGASGVFHACAYCHNNFATNLVPYGNDLECDGGAVGCVCLDADVPRDDRVDDGEPRLAVDDVQGITGDLRDHAAGRCRARRGGMPERVTRDPRPTR